MKTNLLVISAVLLLVTLILPGCRPAIQADRDTLFQVSTISALMQGVYDGDTTIGELRSYGDVGLGTFESLNGEMIVLDGKFYRAQLDGSAIIVPDDTKTPFANVTFFDNDLVVMQDKAMDLSQLQAYIDGLLPSINLFYAIRVDGKFSYVKTRSVPEQNQPYPPLTEAIKNQRISEFRDVEGTMIGFRCPPYVDGVNVPGYHFHFLDKDRQRGGHVLDCQTAEVKIAIDNTANLIMELPGNKGFYKANLGKGEPEGLKQVEQGN